MKQAISRIRQLVGLSQILARLDTQDALIGRIAALQVRHFDKIGSLADVEFRVSSQWGEDGILDWLVERLQIKTETFVEFGCSDYREANTRFLCQNRNWRGLVMDGSEANIARLKSMPIFWQNDLAAQAAFIGRENINDLIAKHLSGEIGLLSIDIDGNDYWVWEAINVVRPIIVVCEYNAVFGDLLPITIPYDFSFVRTRAHHSNLYFGASIEALTHLARLKGYTLVGTNSAGVNAFFVRDDWAARLNIRSTRPCVSRFREARDKSGKLNFTSGVDRLKKIEHLPVFEVVQRKQLRLSEAGNLYSPEWERALGATSEPASPVRVVAS